VHHSINYVEIYVDDVSAAKRLLQQDLRLRFKDYNDDYAGIEAPGGTVKSAASRSRTRAAAACSCSSSPTSSTRRSRR
jgi:hypothetical protein